MANTPVRVKATGAMLVKLNGNRSGPLCPETPWISDRRRHQAEHRRLLRIHHQPLPAWRQNISVRAQPQRLHGPQPCEPADALRHSNEDARWPRDAVPKAVRDIACEASTRSLNMVPATRARNSRTNVLSSRVASRSSTAPATDRIP